MTERKFRWVSEITLDPARAQYAEDAFRRGAHHAVTFLAERLEGVRNIKEARRLADEFADEIGRRRHDAPDVWFDLRKLLANAAG